MNETQQLPDLSSRQLIGLTLLAAAIVGLFALAIIFHKIFFLLVVAILLSIVLEPIVHFWQRLGISLLPAATITYLIFFILLAVGTLILLPALFEQTATVSAFLTDARLMLREMLWKSSSRLLRRAALGIPENPLAFFMPPQAEESPILDSLSTYMTLFFTTALEILVVFLVAFQWNLESERFKRSFLLLIPIQQRHIAKDLLESTYRLLKRFILGQGALCLIIFVMSLVAYMLIGLPSAFALALFAGLMEAVPMIGPTIGAIPAILVALSISPTAAFLVIGAAILIQILENNLLVPKIMSQSVGLRPFVTLIAMIVLSTLFGFLGAVVAIPVAAVLHILSNRYLFSSTVVIDNLKGGRDKVSVIQYELQQLAQDVRKQVQKKDERSTDDNDQIEDSLEAIALDLNSLLVRQGESNGI